MLVLYPDRQLKRLFSFEDQRQQFEASGVDILVVEPFSREFSQLEPDRFVLEYVYRPLNPSHMIVGYDFSFGNSKRGSIDFLKTKGQELGFSLDVVAPVKVQGHLVSSTRIRQALVEGDVQLAHLLLGRAFYTQGLVERGAGRGRTIGIPTANLHVGGEIIPHGGVYAVGAIVDGVRHAAVLNIGTNPTFTAGGSGAPVTVECHILDFDADLYGKEIRIEFVQRLRDEKKFSGVAELVLQIKADSERARALFIKRIQTP